MKARQIGAPGCWGSVIAHNLETRECSSCKFNEKCGEESDRRHPAFVEMLLKKDDLEGKCGALVRPYGVITRSPKGTLRKKKHNAAAKVKKKFSSRYAQLVNSGTPKKTAKILANLENKGMNVHVVAAGVNPLEDIDIYPHFHDGFQKLIDNGSVNRHDLVLDWIKMFAWSVNTANSLASQFISICRNFEVMRVEDTTVVVESQINRKIAA